MSNTQNVVRAIEGNCPTLRKNNEFVEPRNGQSKTVLVFKGDGDVQTVTKQVKDAISSMPNVTAELTHSGSTLEFEVVF